jgi:hypothetical protein
MNLDDIRSLEEAGAELGVSAETLRTQVRRGRLRARLVGKTWITTRDEVERYRRENLGNVGRPKADEAPRRGVTKWSEIKRSKGAPG